MYRIPRFHILFFFFLGFLMVISSSKTFSKSLDDEINDITREIAELENSIAPLKKETTSLQQKITVSKAQIIKIESQVTDLGRRLIDREADLEVQKLLLSERVRRYYINTKKYSPLMVFFSSTENTSLLRQYTWYQSIISQDRSQITNFVQDINNLNQNKQKLEAEKTKLASLKKTLETRFGFLATEIKKAEDYKKELSQELKKLKELKNAMFTTSVGEVSSSDDPASRSDFNPGFSPAFAVFSFGAPHRKGMSQYGAYGRSKSGQSYESILKAYYGNIKIEKINTEGSIKTSAGNLPFEENYLVGIAEMPSSWGDNGGFEALKAQAIAARTYALAYTNNLSGSICVTEACQVYKSSRYQSPGVWKKAVEETRGMVVKSNSTGNIFSTMYASTSGGAIYGYSSLGHSTPQIWDTKCDNQSCWPVDAYEKISGSPWFYKSWYKTRSNQAYGRSHPWLTNEEFSDIINAVIYYSKTDDATHLSQYQNCIAGCQNAWTKDELRRQVSDKGGPVSSVNSVSVDFATSGVTQNVRLSTDKGDFTFSGEDFKEIFTLRAPGALSIKSSLFNVEKK